LAGRSGSAGTVAPFEVRKIIGAGPAILQFSPIFEAQIKKFARNLGWKIAGRIAESEATGQYRGV
jgi:hypothetical protein